MKNLGSLATILLLISTSVNAEPIGGNITSGTAQSPKMAKPLISTKLVVD